MECRMIFGPCGGVRPDGGCEMRAEPCSFVEPVISADEVTSMAPAIVPRVLTDFTVPPLDPDASRSVAEILQGSCDAVLVGEHYDRPDFPPTLTAAMLLAAGVRPWITLTCRDRNRVVLEQELRGLARVGVDTVLCVTGDGRGPDVRPDVTQVFDLDGPRLATLAALVGLCAAVPETPTAPPAHLRANRLVGKQRLGAGVAVLNYVGRPAAVAAFVAQARAAGLRIPVLAAVAVYTDAGSAAGLAGLPGLELDREAVAAVLGAHDPVAAGIERAVAETCALLAIDGVAGVNVSGSASSRDWRLGAEIKAEIGHRVLGGVDR